MKKKPIGKLARSSGERVKTPDFTKPNPKKEMTVAPMPFKKVWPRILMFMVENPDATYSEIWRAFAKKIDDVFDYSDFKKKLSSAGLRKKDVKEGTSLKQQVSKALVTFNDSKKEYAEKHLRRIHKKLEAIHDVVEAMPVDDRTVGRVLDITARLHKEGRLAYGIDDEARGDQKVTNLAVMIGFQPTEKKAQIVEVDPQ